VAPVEAMAVAVAGTNVGVRGCKGPIVRGFFEGFWVKDCTCLLKYSSNEDAVESCERFKDTLLEAEDERESAVSFLSSTSTVAEDFTVSPGFANASDAAVSLTEPVFFSSTGEIRFHLGMSVDD